MEVTKEEALTSATQLFRYALNLGPSHPFARDLSVWIVRHWAMSGTMAVEAVRRERNAKSKQATAAPVNVTDTPARVKFIHPASPQAKEHEAQTPVFPSPLQQVTAQSGEGEGKPRRGRKPKEQQAEPPTQDLRENADVNPVAEDSPLTDAELSAVGSMSPSAILADFGEGRLTATLENIGIEHKDLSGSQKAAAVKVNAAKKK